MLAPSGSCRGEESCRHTELCARTPGPEAADPSPMRARWCRAPLLLSILRVLRALGHPAPSPRLPPGTPPALSRFPASPNPSLRGFSLLLSHPAPRALLHQHGPGTHGAVAACRGAGSGATGWGAQGGEHPELGPGTPRRLVARPRTGTQWHNLVGRCLRNQQEAGKLGFGEGGGGSCPSPLRDPGDICQCFQHAAPSRARRALLVTAPHVPHLQPAASGLRIPASHGWGSQDPPGPWHGSAWPHSRLSPSPGTGCPPAGAGQRCRWVCRPEPSSPCSSKTAALQRMEQ